MTSILTYWCTYHENGASPIKLLFSTDIEIWFYLSFNKDKIDLKSYIDVYKYNITNKHSTVPKHASALNWLII